MADRYGERHYGMPERDRWDEERERYRDESTREPGRFPGEGGHGYGSRVRMRTRDPEYGRWAWEGERGDEPEADAIACQKTAHPAHDGSAIRVCRTAGAGTATVAAGTTGPALAAAFGTSRSDRRVAAVREGNGGVRIVQEEERPAHSPAHGQDARDRARYESCGREHRQATESRGQRDHVRVGRERR